ANQRLVAVRDGAAIAFVGAGHRRWEIMPKRFGWMRVVLNRDLWSEPAYTHLVSRGEAWLRSEGASTAVAHIREDFNHELQSLSRIGYLEVRRQHDSELDLVGKRDQLLARASDQRHRMQMLGLRMLTLSSDADPDRMVKLHEMMIAAEQDIPTTVPMQVMPFEKWKRVTFDNPGIREDRFWIARNGDAIVGLSYIEFPPRRGLPWTSFTATSRSVRGRGIARALKYQTIAQAIELGYTRIRTSNDGANAPILHVNREMGYKLVVPVIELHRDLAPA
ncbi:MAG: GNAT family N-acetyltransferase, partial [Candidatus Dormibacteraeota bacterium]|nr:GNAT family N-acetyltransferase [Candidatus Dormibacteraeota bacterium]